MVTLVNNITLLDIFTYKDIKEGIVIHMVREKEIGKKTFPELINWKKQKKTKI